MPVTLSVVPGTFAVARLRPDAAVAMPSGRFASVTRTEDELSIVCREEDVPPGARVEGGRSLLKVAGPLDFSLTGVMASLASPLAAAGVPLFVVSTFDTDYLLVTTSDLQRTIDALRAAGHTI